MPGRGLPIVFRSRPLAVKRAPHFKQVCAGNAITRAGCWAHLRRRFIDAEKVAPEIAREAIEMIRMLYAVEKAGARHRCR